jgi:hypothetical protein
MWLSLHFLSALLLSLSIVYSPLNAQPVQTADLIEGAKKEDKLVWYTSMAIDTSKPLLDAFEKEIPFHQDRSGARRGRAVDEPDHD